MYSSIDFKRMSDSWSSKFEDLKYTYCVFLAQEELYLKIHNMEPGGSMFNMYSDDIKYIYNVMPIECLENRKLRVPNNWLQKNYLSSYIFNTTKYEILLFINDIKMYMIYTKKKMINLIFIIMNILI